MTSGDARLRGLGNTARNTARLRQHRSEKTSQQWRAVGDSVLDVTAPGLKSQTSRTDSDVLTTYVTRRLK